METSQPLSIESFSYSWLVNLKPSFETLDDSHRFSLDASDEAYFIEMDLQSPASKRFFTRSQDLNFDFPISKSPVSLVHADELISNGFLVPFFVNPLKMETCNGSYSTPTTPISSHAQETMHSARKIRCLSLSRCRCLSKQIFQKYLDFIRPVCEKLRGRRSCSRNEADDTTVAYSVDNWRRSCDSDSSIYEAVLHCKRSIGMPNSSVFLVSSIHVGLIMLCQCIKIFDIFRSINEAIVRRNEGKEVQIMQREEMRSLKMVIRRYRSLFLLLFL